MNYTRRPNRPDGNVYRQMRRQKLGKSRGSHAGVFGRGVGSAMSIVVAVLICLGILAWMRFH